MQQFTFVDETADMGLQIVWRFRSRLAQRQIVKLNLENKWELKGNGCILQIAVVEGVIMSIYDITDDITQQ